MAGLQRSAMSFRRQGSSGSVWDDKFLSELESATQKELQQKQQQEKRSDAGVGDRIQLGGKSAGAGVRRTPARGYRTVKVEEVEEPPSPKVAACGFCGVFGKSPAKKPAAKV